MRSLFLILALLIITPAALPAQQGIEAACTTPNDLACIDWEKGIAYAIGVGRPLSSVKYLLVSDVVSLRYENARTGFSGKVLDLMVQDFPAAKLISLVRDPRAAFASCRHEFINRNGNMYSIQWGTYLEKWRNLWNLNMSMDDCVYSVLPVSVPKR